MEITERYTTQSGKQFVVSLRYNERICDSDPAVSFVTELAVRDAASQEEMPVPTTAARFSTYENFSTFGSYCAINYQGVREAAIEGLRSKILTRVEDMLEREG